jgi:hypothetical protein
VAPPEADQLAVARRIGGNRQMLKDRTRCADRGRGVSVLVGVDTDDNVKILMESQHLVRSLT